MDVCHGLCAVVLEIARGHQRQLVLQAHRTNMVKSVKYGMEMFILFGVQIYLISRFDIWKP